MKTFNKTSGFTLIELVVVIVILGILAATAAPRFIDLQSDAQTSALEGVEGAMLSAANLVHSRALIDGEAGDATDTTTVNGVEEPVAFGYPRSNDDAAATSWENLLDLAGFTVVNIGDSVVIHPDGDAAPATVLTATTGTDTNNCYAVYNETDSANTPPTTFVVPCI